MPIEARLERELNEPQREAVRQTEGPLLIVAGSGSGKTRVLAYRAAYLVQSGFARPYQILALTFTNKAAGELRSRAAEMVGRDGDLLVAGTFHSIFARIMRQEGMNIGVDPRFTIVDTDDKRRLVKEILKDMGVGTDAIRPAEAAWAIEQAKHKMLSPAELASSAVFPNDRTIAQVYEKYEARLKKMSGLDFDDLLNRPILAFQQFPEFLERLQRRFKYVMVDEFQDTNPVQYQLVKSVALGTRNLCAVGDDDQAIYSFRGATVANILGFEQDWPDARIVRLEQNYRSHRQILDLAWSVIQHNPHRRPKKLWTERKEGRTTLLIKARSDEEEALLFVGTIREEKRAKLRRNSDFAILYRTNAQSLPFERALRSASVPYQVVGGLRFYERKEIKDVLAYLRVIVNPADDVSLMRIINYPPRGVGEQAIGAVHQRTLRDGIPAREAAEKIVKEGDLSGRSARALAEFLALMVRLTELSTALPFPDLVERLIAESGLRERLSAEEKEDPSRAESKLANLDSFVADVTRYSELYPDQGIASFLEEVSLVTDADQMEESQDRVSLMTIHTAKGLEFPVVMIGGMEEGMLPLAAPGGSPDDIDEERRLFFVGATRAMEWLALGYAEERMQWGERRYSEPSRFLKEIPPELLAGSWKRSVPQTRTPGAYVTKPLRAPTVEVAGGLNPDDLRKGLIIKHPTFGLGFLVDFRKQGIESKLEVDFDEVGRKTLILKYARLEIVR